ncbi:hypothetical protein [Arachidicoccus terrestris]|uniref:hypothetical protein n=1 Tax=Arachidicoccus terrestris TaxID=2875539 RepID=UPI001CC434D4|nr:hypothetical protein [Arachidicoccus terrestris]UAY56877.1 hypothetical protein K9M52_07775 [Arachidicoccus terrestris]
MGTEVFDAGSQRTGVYLFVHSLKGSDEGWSVLLINTTPKPVTVGIPATGRQYILTLDSYNIKLNGYVLKMTEKEQLPMIAGMHMEKGAIELPGRSAGFLTFSR